MYSRLLLQQRDYDLLEFFLVKNYNEFEKNNLFNRSNHNDILTILTYLTNCLYKNNKHEKSIEYAEKLSRNEMDSALVDLNVLISNHYSFFRLNESIKLS